ncbi:MAG: CRISPR-associated protein [Bacteroidales bacterium]|nr:CRISPR-associated protein [Bacteroidales bacterium]
MLLNLSNHPFENWETAQKEAALKQFGSVVDIPFPAVDPAINTEAVIRLCTEYLSQCISKFGKLLQPMDAIHITGEHCFVFQFVTLAKAHCIPCVCATTNRLVTYKDNIKVPGFQFIQFRNY